MKNKKIIVLATIVILVIIGIIVGVVLVNKSKENDNEKKLAKLCENLISAQSYTFTMEQNSNNKTIMTKTQDKTAIDQYIDDVHTSTIVKDGNTYLVLHERQEYYVYENNNIEQSILTDGLKELLDKDCVKGEEKIQGKKYSYEEYEGSTIFMISNTLDFDDEIRTRFYFDKKGNLVYIKTTYGEKEELLKVQLTDQVNASLFEIPSNYAEN